MEQCLSGKDSWKHAYWERGKTHYQVGHDPPESSMEATAAVGEKRKRSEEPGENPAPKQQKVATVDTMELEDPQAFPQWPDSSGESDF